MPPGGPPSQPPQGMWFSCTCCGGNPQTLRNGWPAPRCRNFVTCWDLAQNLWVDSLGMVCEATRCSRCLLCGDLPPRDEPAFGSCLRRRVGAPPDVEYVMGLGACRCDCEICATGPVSPPASPRHPSRNRGDDDEDDDGDDQEGDSEDEEEVEVEIEEDPLYEVTIPFAPFPIGVEASGLSAAPSPQPGRACERQTNHGRTAADEGVACRSRVKIRRVNGVSDCCMICKNATTSPCCQGVDSGRSPVAMSAMA